MPRFGIIIPTFNGGQVFGAVLGAIEKQDRSPARFIVIDSGSSDTTVDKATAAGAEIIRISQKDFNHGGTRMLGVHLLREICDIVIFLTQDAVLSEPSALRKLLAAFKDDKVLLAYGRQLPRPNAGLIEAFARLHNYSDHSETRSALDIPRIGFKTCFCSNSFSAYRVSALISNGGFQSEVIFGEDALFAAKIVLDGGSVHYEASACVFHSHEYTLRQEFRRFFDIGVMHNRAKPILAAFGPPEGAGSAYFRSEMKFLMKSRPVLIPEAVLRAAVKYVAYKIGRREGKIPPRYKKFMSMNSNFWNNPNEKGYI